MRHIYKPTTDGISAEHLDQISPSDFVHFFFCLTSPLLFSKILLKVFDKVLIYFVQKTFKDSYF